MKESEVPSASIPLQNLCFTGAPELVCSAAFNAVSTDIDDISSDLPSNNPFELRECAGKMEQSLSEDLWCHTINCRARKKKPKKVEFNVEENIIRLLDEQSQETDVQSKIKTLRNIPEGLTLKRKVKKHYDKVPKTTVISTRGLKLRGLLFLHKIGRYFSNFSFSLMPWTCYLKEIESYFGSGIGAVFVFIRLVFMLHVAVLPLNCGLILVPQVLLHIFPNNTFVSGLNGSHTSSDVQSERDKIISVFNIKYSSYFDVSICSLSFPVAYILCIAFCSLILLGIICHRFLTSIKHFLTEEGEMRRGMFSSLVFTGWDHNITHQQVALQRSKRIKTMLKELIEVAQQTPEHKFQMQRFMKYIAVFTVNFMVCSLCVILAFLLYYYWPAHVGISKLVVLFRSGIFALIFLILAKVQTHCNLAMTSLKVQQRIRLAVYGYCSLLVSAVISTVLCFFQLDVITEQQCWEDKLGDELLSSLLWNFILWLVVYPIFTLTRSSLAKSKTTFQYSPEYDCCHFIHLALLFYTIVWLSCYFSPLIPVIGVLLFTFVFYLFKFILLQHSRCSFEPWHVGKTYSSMLTMLLVLHGMVMSIQCYVLFTMKSSQICGPFIHVKYPYEIIFQIFLAFGLKKTAVDVIFYLLKPGVIPIIITLWIGLVYYLKEKANCKTELIVKLEQHIVMEAKDKGYLLNLVKMNLNVRNAGRLPSSSMEPGGREVMLSTQG